MKRELTIQEQEIKKQSEYQIREKIKSRWNNSYSKYVLHIGPTNSGKTYQALQSLKAASSGVYLSPLRLLAWEVYDKLNSEGYDCSLITGEERIIIPNARFVASTVEMCNVDKHYDVAVIDESFMLCDNQRGKFWLRAILGVKANTVHIISNFESSKLLKNLLRETNRPYQEHKYFRKTPLKVWGEKFSIKKPPSKSILVVFSRINVLYYKMILQQQGKKVSILYGNLPPEVKKEQIKLFLDGETEILISTDVIGMGINLPCDNVIFLESHKFDGEIFRKLNPKEIKQIGGRAGRYKMSDCGYVGTTESSFIPDIELAMDSNIIETTGYYGLDGEIYQMLVGSSPRKKIQFFESLNASPSTNLICEDLSRYNELTLHSDINLLSDETAWAFLSCPTNKYNIGFWKSCVSNIAYGNVIKFKYDYSLEEIPSVRYLEYAEISVGIIDLFRYMHNNKILNNHISDVNMEEIQKHRDVLIENINTYLLTKKIKQKEVHLSGKY